MYFLEFILMIHIYSKYTLIQIIEKWYAYFIGMTLERSELTSSLYISKKNTNVGSDDKLICSLSSSIIFLERE